MRKNKLTNIWNLIFYVIYMQFYFNNFTSNKSLYSGVCSYQCSLCSFNLTLKYFIITTIISRTTCMVKFLLRFLNSKHCSWEKHYYRIFENLSSMQFLCSFILTTLHWINPFMAVILTINAVYAVLKEDVIEKYKTIIFERKTFWRSTQYISVLQF